MSRQEFQDLFLALLSQVQPGSLTHLLDLSFEARLSTFMDMCPIQDAYRFRAKHLGMRLAGLLLDDKGELQKGLLKKMNELFARGLYLLGPGRENDAAIFHHLALSLKALEEKPEIWVWIKKFSPPLVHKRAEELIRETLWPEPVRSVQTPHIRKAVLAAWLTLLRQTTGSCFATAPAILIQRDNPIRFFKDLYDLLSTGKMKRIINGNEYAVPLSPNSGKTDLQKPIEFAMSVLAYSPALMAALEAAGLLDPAAPIQTKIGQVRTLLKEREGPQTIERLLRAILLESAGLTEEDLESEEHLSRMQMSPLLAKQSAVYYQRPSERAQKIADWKKKFKDACSTFQAFAECPLLRAWEYTIASFCDVKVDFARWNLYMGLGLHNEQKGGMGWFLFEWINHHLQRCNEEAAHFHQEHERSLQAARGIEGAIHASLSDSYRNQMKAELASFVHAANVALEMRDRAQAKAEALAGFYSSLVKQFDAKLQDYFQELFDPSLFGKQGHIYEDSPAGFRLVYKHGRADPSQWTSIFNGEQYIESLRDFLSRVESDLEMPPQIDRQFLADLMTALIQYIQEPAFLQNAMRRSKEHGRQSPWDYISGGTMETLCQAYWNRSQPVTEAALAVRSEEELLAFISKEAVKDPLLIHSPTHAFVLHSHRLPQQWAPLIAQCREWWGKWKIDENIEEHLTHRLSEKLPLEERPLFIHMYRQKQAAPSYAQFRLQLIDCLQSIKDSRVRNRAALVDSLLFEELPVLDLEEAKNALHKVLGVSLQLNGSLYGSYELYEIAKVYALKQTKTPLSQRDWDREIIDRMRAMGCSYPHPLLFADSNWSGWYFGFIVNPATLQLELWRLNRIGNTGFSMHDWKEWMTQKNTAQWVIFTKPEEYSDPFS